MLSLEDAMNDFKLLAADIHQKKKREDDGACMDIDDEDASSGLEFQTHAAQEFGSSPPLWKTHSSSHDEDDDYKDEVLCNLTGTGTGTGPNRRITTTRVEAILNAKKELMEVIQAIPESSYELSLKDIVVADQGNTLVDSTTTDETPEKPLKVSSHLNDDDQAADEEETGWKEKKRMRKMRIVKRRRRRPSSSSFDNDAPRHLLKIFPPFLSVERNKPVGVAHGKKLPPVPTKNDT